MSKRNKEFWQYNLDNNLTYLHYYDRLLNIACATIGYDGLPDTVDQRYFELILISEGRGIIFEDEDLGMLGLRMSSRGNYNEYLIPKNRRAIGANGYNKELDESNSVIFYNDYMHRGYIRDISMFARRIANLERAADVNANAQKTPYFVVCEESQRLTIENFFKKIDENASLIIANNSLKPDQIKVFNTNAPFTADKLHALKSEIWNEALTFLGVSNLSVQKKERLITDEVERSQGGTFAARIPRIEMRKKACDELNKKFGLNVTPYFRDMDASELSMDGGEKG